MVRFNVHQRIRSDLSSDPTTKSLANRLLLVLEFPRSFNQSPICQQSQVGIRGSQLSSDLSSELSVRKHMTFQGSKQRKLRHYSDLRLRAFDAMILLVTKTVAVEWSGNWAYCRRKAGWFVWKNFGGGNRYAKKKTSKIMMRDICGDARAVECRDL